MEALTKSARAKLAGCSRATLYYHSKLEAKDAALRRDIEVVLRTRAGRSYGYRRVAAALNINEKRVRRVMRKFGIKPYRRHGRRYRRTKPQDERYPNLLQLVTPSYEGCVWAADFTHVFFRGLDVSVATTMDLFTRKIVGVAVSTKHDARLIIAAFGNALLAHGRPAIFHSDNGCEYHAKSFRTMLTDLGISISRSKKGCPWENGYQESFYDKFKVDLGDPNRFASLGELTAAIYETIHCYNTERIHSALKMSPAQFARLHAAATLPATH
jgi:transposase InsO family protein